MFVWQLPVEVCKLFNVTAILHTPTGVGNARISRHYRASFTATFILHPVSLRPLAKLTSRETNECKLYSAGVCDCECTFSTKPRQRLQNDLFYVEWDVKP